MENRKKIALLLPSLSGGGAERMAGLVSKKLAETNDVYIMLFNKEKMPYEYSGEIIDLDFNAIHKKYKKYGSLIYKILLPFKYREITKRVKKIRETYQIDACISFLETSNLLNLLSTNKGKKSILSTRNYRSLRNDNLKERVQNKLIKHTYSKADLIISLSHGVKTDLVENFGLDSSKITVIYNMFDVEKIQLLSKEDIDNEHKEFFSTGEIIIHVGRLFAVKNQSQIINQFKIVKDSYPNAKLALVGTGPLEEELKSQTEALGLTQSVRFVPFTSNPFKYLAKAKIFILNSKHEGFANVIVEAMICGVPVIATDCLSGPRELILGSTDYSNMVSATTVCPKGILIPVNSKNEISAAIKQLLSVPKLRADIIEAAKKDVHNYHFEKISSQWKTEILRVLRS